jgi:NAD(P)H-dependent flavin oxidoreductase YrpB (nitropropane dioxygenase family)
MARASSGALAAAVSNAGGFGVIGGLNYSPQQLQDIINELKSHLTDKSLPFGVDLALPKIGKGARKTNRDYTKGKLDDLIDVVIRNGAKLFVSAVGVPPPHIIERLHASNILIMNMVGAPKHAKYALDAGVDLICAQGAEGGGHTGTIASSILIPAVCDVVTGYRSPMTGEIPLVVAAGGIRDGRSLASALMQGAAGVWVGTRFLASAESGASQMHKQEVVTANFEDTVTTLVVSGRPMRVKANEYIKAWERRPEKIKELTEAGIVPYAKDVEDGNEEADRPFLMGQVAAVIDEIIPASHIVESMVKEASHAIKQGARYVVRDTKL